MCILNLEKETCNEFVCVNEMGCKDSCGLCENNKSCEFCNFYEQDVDNDGKTE